MGTTVVLPVEIHPSHLSHGTPVTMSANALVPALSASQFVVGQCQAVAFTPDEEVSTAKLTKDLLPRWVSSFDGEPFLLPLSGVPRQVPKAILTDRLGGRRAEIASERVTISWNWLPNAQQPIDPASFFPEATRLINDYQRVFGVRIARLAALRTNYAPHPNPGMLLARHFCRDRWADAPLNRPENLELHAHKTFDMGGSFRVNSWVRNKTGVLATGGDTPRPIVLVEQDINTIDNDQAGQSYSPSSVEKFFELSTKEFDTILRLYYP